jgi:MFS transporter, OPA family, sugar phosphate sensor protein UhpC
MPAPATYVFISATIGYSIYYVCRLSFSVVKVPLVQEQVLTESQIGLVGSGLFYAYAVGKLVNGFVADRANLTRFMTIGLLGTALVNLALGFEVGFVAFALLWLVNGWVQSMGAPSCIVGLSRWFPRRQFGTAYGLWSASHNIGEGLTFVAVAVVSTHLGWRWGFWSAAASGLLGSLVVARFFHNRPPAPPSEAASEAPPYAGAVRARRRFLNPAQVAALRNPVIWLLALSSAFMYSARYAINSWGIFFLELGKGCSRIEAGTIISLNAVFGVLGTVASGWVSDRWFPTNRFLPALLAGLLNAASLALFLFAPPGLRWLDYVSMIGFGISIGALICYLGGLLAVDSAAKEAAGAALGVVGIASYIGAGLQDATSGYLIERFKGQGEVASPYDFGPVSLFWIGASVTSMLVTAVIWRLSRRRASAATPPPPTL